MIRPREMSNSRNGGAATPPSPVPRSASPVGAAFNFAHSSSQPGVSKCFLAYSSTHAGSTAGRPVAKISASGGRSLSASSSSLGDGANSSTSKSGTWRTIAAISRTERSKKCTTMGFGGRGASSAAGVVVWPFVATEASRATRGRAPEGHAPAPPEGAEGVRGKRTKCISQLWLPWLLLGS
eukprot:CAMPEP_0115260816 /NCGR_PEP_ID=MMETSP0270-20121206/48533_1 /TAXON_ID=71861 /ORGANISM="Scrippsiella trochoidea, Strain CCMP3099" /LENGTH=180 /DNA_ID=CAMNT_0002676665 /DNA_START=701 /DNA_END=1240 /DNA_ORIENTATION=-